MIESFNILFFLIIYGATKIRGVIACKMLLDFKSVG